MGWLFILFTVLPALEIYVLIQVGGVIGGWNTVAVILGMGVFGAWIARQQGLATLYRVQAAMAEGRVPTGELVDGALILVGGVLLVTPGFLTDAVGLTFLLPPLRALWKLWAVRVIRRRIDRGQCIIRTY